MEKPELSVMTFNVKGKLPFSIHMREAELVKFINNSKFNWQYIDNVNNQPHLLLRVEELCITVKLFFNGSLLLFNSGNMANAEALVDLIMQDFKKNCPKLFQESHLH